MPHLSFNSTQVLCAKKNLSNRQQALLERSLELLDYVCGADLRNAISDDDETSILHKVPQYKSTTYTIVSAQLVIGDMYPQIQDGQTKYSDRMIPKE